jgi:hypothetical protein
MQTKKIKDAKDIIERNYMLMKQLFVMVPEPILNVEETFLKNISTTNISILENIQKQFGNGSLKYGNNTGLLQL